MERSHFLRVREAFATQHQVSLDRLGVETQKGGNQSWQAVNCPLCSDTSGSASIAKTTGFLNCHQCGRKQDLFEWWGEKNGCNDWDACKQIAECLGVHLEKPKKAARAVRMTPDLLDRAIHNLLDSPEAEGARAFLNERKLFKPRMLAELGVGFLDGAIIFAQFDANGKLRNRHRTYNWLAKSQWRWSKGDGPPNGFWPFRDLPPDAEILICEGEMDTMTALMRMNLHRRKVPIYAFTWTGGANAIINSLIPDSWKGRTVWICYDNDTFQGANLKGYQAPDEKKLRDLMRRRENLLNGVAGRFKANGCNVKLLAVPINPIDNWGADLRDHVNQEGSFDTLRSWDIDDVGDLATNPEEVSHLEVFTSAGKFIKTIGSVATIEQNTITVPSETRIVCPMGSKPACNNCGVPKMFVDQHIEWKLERKKLLAALMSKDPDAHIIRNVLCKPNSCNECFLEHEVYTNGSYWTALPSGAQEGDGTELIHIVSTQRPSLSGEVGITGYAYHTVKSVGILATDIEQLDKPQVDLNRWHQPLCMLTPQASQDIDLINKHVDSMVHDLTHNVTKIYGRPEIHITTMLVAHSPLWFNIDGHRVRGWIDACVFGDTRKGKSETIKRLFEHWRLGNHFTCMENFSRAGLTVGGAEGGAQIRPGLWPKNNKKLLFLDEFHHMEGLMEHLQSARDEGFVSALKIYGNLHLPAAVRLITAGNWSHRNRRHFQYVCQHLLALYGIPEGLSRMDFAWAVYGDVSMVPEEVEHLWTSDLCRALVLRAWAMEEHQIHVDPAAIKLAQQQCQDWDAMFATDEVPLHTGIEKHLSILRIATAIANICYSYPEGNEAECLVLEVHVMWAIEWVLKTWENLQYNDYSNRVMQARNVKQPFHVEAAFTVQLALGDPDHALVILSRLAEANNARSLMGLIMGNGSIEEPRHFTKWLGMLQRCSALQEKRATNDFHITYLPSPGAITILERLVSLAQSDPEAYVKRFEALSSWFSSHSESNPLGLEPLDQSEPESFLDEMPPF